MCKKFSDSKIVGGDTFARLLSNVSAAPKSHSIFIFFQKNIFTHRKNVKLDDLLPLSRNIDMTADTISPIDEQRIISLLKSDQISEQNKGFAMLIAQKKYLLRNQNTYHLNDEDLKDIFYEALFILQNKIHGNQFEYRKKGSLEAYFYTIVKGKISNESKKKRLAELTVDRAIEGDPLMSIFSCEALERVKEILDKKIGEDCRKILLKQHYEGMKQKEIAEEMKLALGTIKNNSSACMKKLKTLISQNPKLKQVIFDLLNNPS